MKPSPMFQRERLPIQATKVQAVPPKRRGEADDLWRQLAKDGIAPT